MDHLVQCSFPKVTLPSQEVKKKLANMWFNYTVVNYQIMLALKPALFLCKACVKRERELEGEDEREVGER